MAGELEALIVCGGRPATGLVGVPVLRLSRSGLWLLPLTDATKALIDGQGGVGARVEGFYNLTEPVVGLGHDLSAGGDKVLYVHVEFFGGEGFHAAIGWQHGQTAFGPAFTQTSPGQAEDWYLVADCSTPMAVNEGLRWLGVDAPAGGQDEFDLAGLGRYRFTHEWIASPGPTEAALLYDLDLIGSEQLPALAAGWLAADVIDTASVRILAGHDPRDTDEARLLLEQVAREAAGRGHVEDRSALQVAVDWITARWRSDQDTRAAIRTLTSLSDRYPQFDLGLLVGLDAHNGGWGTLPADLRAATTHEIGYFLHGVDGD